MPKISFMVPINSAIKVAEQLLQSARENQDTENIPNLENDLNKLTTIRNLELNWVEIPVGQD